MVLELTGTNGLQYVQHIRRKQVNVDCLAGHPVLGFIVIQLLGSCIRDSSREKRVQEKNEIVSTTTILIYNAHI